MEVSKLAEQVAQEYDAARNAYKRAQECDRMEQARRDGAVTEQRRFKYAEFEQHANSAVFSARERALTSVEKAMNEARAELTRAPSSEAVSYLTSIASRNDMTADEINAAMDKYGGNHSVEKALLSAASRSGMHVLDTRTHAEKTIDDLRTMSGKVDRYFTPLNISNTSESGAWLARADIEGAL